MALEIERKFLVKGDAWRALATGTHYRQGYLSSSKERTVRVRTIDETAFLTIKGPNQGIARTEFEYAIAVEDARVMLDTMAERPIIEKKRYRIPYKGFVWEVDEFFGVNEGLIVAEIELPSEDTVFETPEWIGEEVSGDVRYFNSSLVRNPYTTWK